jgi:hypothetical protein
VDIETREGILLEIMAEKRIMIHDDTWDFYCYVHNLIK